ncbi:MAG: ABC transporter permease [Verrucomicrobiota bacterium]
MRAYLIRRLLLIPVTLLGVTLIVFGLTRILPGGPYEQALQRAASGEGARSRTGGSGGSSLTPDQKEQLRMQFSMNDGFVAGYLKWLGILPREVNARFVPLGEDNTEPMVLLGYLDPQGKAYSRKALILDFKDPSKPPRLQFPPPETGAPEGWSVRFGLDEKTDAQGRTTFEPDASRIVAYREKRSGLLQGDFQESLSSGEPVATLISRRLPVSLFYGILTTILTYLIAIPLGIVKAIRHRTFLDNATSVALFVGYAIPGFALGTLLLLWFSFRFDWFPMSGFTSTEYASLSPAGKLKDLLHHAALPLVCYMIGSWTMYSFLMKNSLMDVLATDYVRTAVAKGVSFSKAITGHALRNAIIPIASTFGQNVSLILTGSVLIENVFDIPGIGQLGFESALHRDYTTMMALITLSSALLMVGNLLSDLLIAALNPRIRFD